MVNNVPLCGMWTTTNCHIWKRSSRGFNQRIEKVPWRVSSDQRKEAYIFGYEYKYNIRLKGLDRYEREIVGRN